MAPSGQELNSHGPYAAWTRALAMQRREGSEALCEFSRRSPERAPCLMRNREKLGADRRRHVDPAPGAPPLPPVPPPAGPPLPPTSLDAPPLPIAPPLPAQAWARERIRFRHVSSWLVPRRCVVPVARPPLSAMGVPKRKVLKRKAPDDHDGAAFPAGAAKRASGDELTGVQFKTQLRDSQDAGPALEAFVSAAKKLPQEGVYDVVEGYIKISVECAEIFQLLSGEKRPESEILLIFQAFEAILLRTASDLSHFHAVGTNIVKKLLNNHMKLICESLYASGYRLARACLNLMAALVAQGAEATRDVCSHFDLNKKPLYALVTKRDSKGVPDVRLAYIRFALSFLIAGDDSTIVQVLELKEFIPCIFSSGVKEDRISTVSLLLSTLKTKVVHNKNITKTQKVRFFTGQLLNQIASLYAWRGITDVDTDDVKPSQASAEEAGKTVVREMVHDFLTDLCCSLKHGINFYDPSFGTFGRGGNLTLLHFLLGLKTAAEDELVAELVVNILKVCPDLLNKYFKEVTFSFLPRVKSAWLNNIKLLNKIYEAQPEISRAFQTREFIPLPRLLPMVMVTTVPLVCNKIMFTQALNLDSKSVKHTALSLISVILKRALKNIDHCLNKEVWQDSGVYTPEMMEEFVRLFREALSKILPDLNTVVWVWQSLRKQETKQDDEKGKKRDDMTPAASVVPQSDDAETLLLKAVLLQVICLYQKVVPHVVMQYNFDFSKLLKGVILDQGSRDEVPPVLQYHILKVALELPASKFLWLKAQEGPDAEIVGGERSVFYLLMKMFVTSSHSHLKSSTKLLIMKILRDTGVFEHTWKELELWLEHLDSTVEEKKETVIQFLESVLLTLVANPYSYTDKASDFVQEASTLQATMTKQDADDVSIPVSHIDDVLDMVDVLVEGSEGLDEEIGFSLNEDMILLTFPFSAVIPAALEARNKLLLGTEKEAGASVVAYLTTVLTDLLHTQRDPLALCLLLQAYDKLELPGSPWCKQLCRFHRYYSLWIPEQAREALPLQTSGSIAPPAPSLDSSFSALLKSAYESKDVLLDEGVQAQLQAAIPHLPLHQVLRAVKHVLLYLRTTVENFSQLGRSVGPPLVQLFMDLLRSLLVHCEQLDAQNQQRCEAARAEADLFLDMESLASLELTSDKTLEGVLTAILRHPTLEGWFLALEQQALPPHTLSPILVKLLAARLSAGVLQLLVTSAPILRNTGQQGLLRRYSEAITQSVLKELRARRAGPATSLPKALPQLEALQALYPYMGGAQLREITLALLALPEACLLTQRATKSPAQGRHLNVLGKTLVQLLTSIPQDQPPSGELLWASEYMRGLGVLLPALAMEELDTVFLHALQRDPELAPVVGVSLLDYCLAQQTPVALHIATLLLQQSCTHLLRFELWCLRAGSRRVIQEDLDTFLPLIHAYLQCRSCGHFTRPAGVSFAVTPVLRKALWRQLQSSVLSADDPPESGMHQEVLSQLVPFARAKDLGVLMDHLPTLLQTPSNHRSWIVADSVSGVLERSTEELHAWKKILLESCIKCLIESFSSRQQDGYGTQDQEKQMLLRLNELLLSLNEVDPGDWQKFVKTGLKSRYQDHAFLKALHAAIQLLYLPESPLFTKLLPLPTVHVMLTQHSLFLSSMLKSQGEENPDSQVKEALVDLMLTVVKLCPSVCESSHFAVLLGAYGATLSILDQKILLLLRAYEKNSVSLISFRVLLWGPAAVEHHKTSRSLGKSLWQQPSVGDILRLLDRDRMLKTILHFPQNRKLLPPEDAQEFIFKDRSIVDLKDLYDPCFLLHLFSELTRPEFVVDCRKFLDSNSLGLTVAALSSYDPKMRAAAYYVLAAYYSQLEGARFREQAQLLYLLDVVRNGIRSQNMRLTFSLSLFIAKAALQILKPEEHMYLRISKVLLSHQDLNMNKVPGFYQLFYSSDFEQKTEQEWVLGLLRQGIRDKHCYALYARQGVFHIILSFFNSPLCDEAAQTLILEILRNAAQVAKSAYEIIRDYSLLTWLVHTLESRFLETRLLSSVISLVHTLWMTNLGDRVVEPESQPPCKPGSQEPPKLLALHLIDEFLYVLIALVKHLRPTLDPAQVTSFFSALDSVLRYRATVMRAFKEMNRFTVNERMLATKDVLILLHKWSLIGRDTKLQEDLKTVAEKHQVRELTKMIKEKNKPIGLARSKGPRGRKRRPGEAGETAAPELKAASLDTCRELLRSVLTHWEPVFPGPEPSQEPEDGATPESSALHATASLVANWVLRTVAKHPPSGSRAARLLGWLKSYILPQPVVVADLLRDGSVRSGLFKLYSRLCGAEGLVGPAQGLACLFNTVMMQLVATQGPMGSPFHLAIEALCLTSLTDEDEATRAAAAFLVSLYIKDLWLGTLRPDTLLDHVRMLHDAAEEAPSCGDGSQAPEGAVLLLCKDIIASATDA
ncbi:nucleolar pre-ribosomal-associated protein 1 isoform X2 [Elephas maximus indicus]|uniref:nucleolar pre-ribosomal-associated protein 1 isoform X2 n=1 Tax=Elephas maximus indicus TaxID=99487 RepID=UPI002116FE27|nr:nucleolar pre-ribosomal-associated protein 1 isoform X2 [Elephas maximus indicus]